MKAQTRGAAALSLGVGSGLCAWVFWAHGFLATAAAGLGLLAVALVFALVRERRGSARLERALGRETERARQVSDHAWQSALLTQVVDELRISPDEVSVLQTATMALVRTLKASRAVVYRREDDDAIRVRAQSASEGVAPLQADAVLPPVLASDRELAERLSTSNLTEEADPELRALAERLQVHSIVVVPVGDDYILAVDQCEGPRSWTSTERRFIERFADQLASALHPRRGISRTKPAGRGALWTLARRACAFRSPRVSSRSRNRDVGGSAARPVSSECDSRRPRRERVSSSCPTRIRA